MSTIDDFRSATFAAQSYDATVGVAYASSPLGDPAIEDGSLFHLAEFEDFPPTTVTAEPPAEAPAEPEPPAEPRPSRWTNLLVGVAVLAALGTVSGLGVMLVNGTGSKEKPAVVAPNSSVGSIPPQAPGAVPPSPVAPSLAAPADGGQGPAGPVRGGDAPAWTGPAPAPAPADPGIPPAATPAAPPVIVKAPPPVVPAPIYVPLPPHHEGGKHGGDDHEGGKHRGDDEQGGGQSGGGKNGGGQPGGSGQQGGKGQKVGGQPVPVGGGHPGQVACLPCQQPHAPGKK
jgi:hypothetical protein